MCSSFCNILWAEYIIFASHYAVKRKPTVSYVSYISVRLGKKPMDVDALSTSSVSREGNRLFPWNSFQLGLVLYSHQFLEFTVGMFQCCRKDLHWIRIHSTVCHSQDFQTLMCPKHRAEVLPPEITPITALWSVWEKKRKGLIVRD